VVGLDPDMFAAVVVVQVRRREELVRSKARTSVVREVLEAAENRGRKEVRRALTSEERDIRDGCLFFYTERTQKEQRCGNSWVDCGVCDIKTKLWPPKKPGSACISFHVGHHTHSSADSVTQHIQRLHTACVLARTHHPAACSHACSMCDTCCLYKHVSKGPST
jgi:hypothetical protein